MKSNVMVYNDKSKGLGYLAVLILLCITAVMLYSGCSVVRPLRTSSIDCVDKTIAEMIVYKRHNPDAKIYAAVAKSYSRIGSQNHVEPVVKMGGKYHFFGFDSLFENIEEHDMSDVFEEQPAFFPMEIFMKAAGNHKPLTLNQLRIYNAIRLTRK
jgi:hypothetical protein